MSILLQVIPEATESALCSNIKKLAVTLGIQLDNENLGLLDQLRDSVKTEYLSVKGGFAEPQYAYEFYNFSSHSDDLQDLIDSDPTLLEIYSHQSLLNISLTVEYIEEAMGISFSLLTDPLDDLIFNFDEEIVDHILLARIRNPEAPTLVPENVTSVKDFINRFVLKNLSDVSINGLNEQISKLKTQLNMQKGKLSELQYAMQLNQIKVLNTIVRIKSIYLGES